MTVHVGLRHRARYAVTARLLLFLLPLVGPAIGGLPIGVCQWLVLWRHIRADGSWILLTLAGFAAAGALAVVLAAALFVPSYGLTTSRAFLSLAIPTPLIRLSQSVVLRRWTVPRRLWLVASTIGWSAFVAIEVSAPDALPAVNSLTGMLVSAMAGYLVASRIGATLLGGAAAGAITGMTLAFALGDLPDRGARHG